MNLKSKIRNVFYASLLLIGSASCSDWLDVQMEDQVMENTLYDSNKGFQIALNGIYLDMANLYINDLTAGELDVMAQYYYVTENYDHSYKIYSGYKFDDVSFENYADDVWTKAYRLIANTNTLLEHCDEDDSKVSAEYYPIVKGEALALRAMLHFDILRLFGPVYSVADGPSQKCIPYQLSSSKDIQPLLPASEVLQHVIDDLEAASKLLYDTDPIITDGIRNSIQNDNGLANDNLNYRQLRLNYYAVQALLGRAYAWKGDKAKAYEIAKNNIIDKITTEDLEVFPWAKKEDFEAEGKPDKLFSSEVFFAIYTLGRESVYTGLFSENLDAKKGRLTFVGTTLADSKFETFYDDPNDWRRGMWDVFDGGEASGNQTAEDLENKKGLYLTKFKGVEYNANLNGTELYRYMMPLVRLSEIYLMAAEGAPTREEALKYINVLRTHRACRNLEDDSTLDLQNVITKEFAREVIGEGQLFYYYKRNAMTEIISGTSVDGTYGMVLSNYVLPLPKSETDKRVM